MCIIRVKHDKQNPYVIINREALWDPNLSLEAVGLWARLLSRPDDWHVNAIELSKSCGCHRNTIYKLLKELQENGYCVKQQVHAPNGKFSSVEYHVFEKKLTPEEIQIILPLHKNTHTAKPYTAGRALLSNEKKLSKKTYSSPEPSVVKAPSEKLTYTKEEEEFFSQRMKDIPKKPVHIHPSYKAKVIETFRQEKLVKKVAVDTANVLQENMKVNANKAYALLAEKKKHPERFKANFLIEDNGLVKIQLPRGEYPLNPSIDPKEWDNIIALQIYKEKT